MHVVCFFCCFQDAFVPRTNHATTMRHHCNCPCCCLLVMIALQLQLLKYRSKRIIISMYNSETTEKKICVLDCCSYMNLLPCHCFSETFIACCCIVVGDFFELDEVLMLQGDVNDTITKWHETKYCLHGKKFVYKSSYNFIEYNNDISYN